MSSSRNFALKSADGETFEVEEAVALKSKTIKDMINNNPAMTSIPIPKVTGEILAKVVEYCQRHVDAATRPNDNASQDALKKFDDEFVKVDAGTLLALVEAAEFLSIESLLKLTCDTVSGCWFMSGKIPEEIRMTYNVMDTFTEKEKKEFRRGQN